MGGATRDVVVRAQKEKSEFGWCHGRGNDQRKQQDALLRMQMRDSGDVHQKLVTMSSWLRQCHCKSRKRCHCKSRKRCHCKSRKRCHCKSRKRCHCKSRKRCHCFHKGDFGGASERWVGAHMGFLRGSDAILN